ncbi:MAG: hypothetical protein KDD73_02270 [Anaerolineales bacterium]|nr:hypothetical protein [Anaerolineales bacterium]MCB9127276.1 hypothetical protein [Ardenticatenales bacterium]
MILPLFTALAIALWGILWYREEQSERGHLSISQVKARLQPQTLSPTELESLLIPREMIRDFDSPFDAEATPEALPYPQNPVPLNDDRAGAIETPTEEAGETLMGYCVRCRAKRFLVRTEITTTRNGRPAVRGECAICGAGMLVFSVSDKQRDG